MVASGLMKLPRYVPDKNEYQTSSFLISEVNLLRVERKTVVTQTYF